MEKSKISNKKADESKVEIIESEKSKRFPKDKRLPLIFFLLAGLFALYLLWQLIVWMFS